MAANCFTCKVGFSTHAPVRRRLCRSKSRQLRRFGRERQKRYSNAPILRQAGEEVTTLHRMDSDSYSRSNTQTTTNLPPAQMIFVQHWFEELKRLVPAH